MPTKKLDWAIQGRVGQEKLTLNSLMLLFGTMWRPILCHLTKGTATLPWPRPHQCQMAGLHRKNVKTLFRPYRQAEAYFVAPPVQIDESHKTKQDIIRTSLALLQPLDASEAKSLYLYTMKRRLFFVPTI